MLHIWSLEFIQLMTESVYLQVILLLLFYRNGAECAEEHFVQCSRSGAVCGRGGQP